MAETRVEISRSPEEEFEQRFRSLVRQDEWVLDAGCATGKFFATRRSNTNNYRVMGLDALHSVSQNSYVDFRVCGDVNALPFADNSFHVIYTRWLVEHLQRPALAFREFYRVLKADGRLVLFTTNLLHYYGAAAKLTPHWFHLWFNQKVRGFSDDDIFPTYYRANTRSQLDKLLLNAGFQQSAIEIILVEGAPNFLAFNLLAHRFGMCYEYFVKRFESLSSFRMNLIAIARKK